MTEKCERVYVIEGLDLSPVYLWSNDYCQFVLVLSQGILKPPYFFGSTLDIKSLDVCKSRVFNTFWPYSALEHNICVYLCVYLFFSILSLLTCLVATLKILKRLVLYTFKESCVKGYLLLILLGNGFKFPKIIW